jgi:hypothetical protein
MPVSKAGTGKDDCCVIRVTDVDRDPRGDEFRAARREGERLVETCSQVHPSGTGSGICREVLANSLIEYFQIDDHHPSPR